MVVWQAALGEVKKVQFCTRSMPSSLRLVSQSSDNWGFFKISVNGVDVLQDPNGQLGSPAPSCSRSQLPSMWCWCYLPVVKWMIGCTGFIQLFQHPYFQGRSTNFPHNGTNISYRYDSAAIASLVKAQWIHKTCEADPMLSECWTCWKLARANWLWSSTFH